MKMIMFTNEQYYELVDQIKSDKVLEAAFQAQGLRGGKVLNPVGWQGTLASALLRGAVDVPDKKKPALPIRKFEFVRYGWDTYGHKKNVLYTIKDESRGVIYYGVSRCDLRYDQFKRADGVKLAKERAETARKVGHNLTPRFRFCNSVRGANHSAPMYGVAKMDKVKELLAWFDDVG